MVDQIISPGLAWPRWHQWLQWNERI